MILERLALTGGVFFLILFCLVPLWATELESEDHPPRWAKGCAWGMAAVIGFEALVGILAIWGV